MLSAKAKSLKFLKLPDGNEPSPQPELPEFRTPSTPLSRAAGAQGLAGEWIERISNGMVLLGLDAWDSLVTRLPARLRAAE
jgi:hypothetical protein